MDNEDANFSFFPDNNLFGRYKVKAQDSIVCSPPENSFYENPRNLESYCRRLFQEDEQEVISNDFDDKVENTKHVLSKIKYDEFAVPQTDKKSAHDCQVFNSQQTLQELPIVKLTDCFKTPLPRETNVFLTDVKEEEISPYPANQLQERNLAQSTSAAFSEDGIEDLVMKWSCNVDLNHMLERQFENFIESDVFPVYEFQVPVDVQHLIQFNASLGSMLMRTPMVFFSVLKQICFKMLNHIGKLKNLYTYQQVLIQPLLCNVPAIVESTVESSQDALRMNKNGGKLLRLRGLVIGVSSISSYTKSAKYHCPQEDCVWAGDNCYLIAADVGTAESNIIRTDWPCIGCGSILKEDISKRMFSDKKYCYVLPKQATKGFQQVNHLQSHCSKVVKVVVKDKVCDNVSVGSCYWFYGIQELTVSHGLLGQQQVESTFQVMTMEQDVPFINKVKNFQKVLPDSLCSLFKDRSGSPWSFVASLSYCFLESIAPPGTCHLFKTCLLMSLVMEGDNSFLDMGKPSKQNNQLHVLLEDDDLLLHQRLMFGAAEFSTSPLIHRVPMDLFGTVSDDGCVTFANGGSLSLASSSVCVIPNMLELKKNALGRLQKVFEDNTVTVDVPRKQHEEAQQSQFFLPFKCTVWSCCELQKIFTSRDVVHKDSSVVTPALASEFHLVFSKSTGKWSPKEVDEVLATHILRRSFIAEKPDGFMSHADMKEFITRVRSQEVKMSSAAYRLLKTFYLVSRRVNDSVAKISQTSLQTLLSLSAAHAKLMLHEKVSVNDAVASICIFEQIMAFSNGESILGVNPTLHFSVNDMASYIGPENDARMFQLKRHIVQYCSTYYPEALDGILQCEE